MTQKEKFIKKLVKLFIENDIQIQQDTEYEETMDDAYSYLGEPKFRNDGFEISLEEIKKELGKVVKEKFW